MKGLVFVCALIFLAGCSGDSDSSKTGGTGGSSGGSGGASQGGTGGSGGSGGSGGATGGAAGATGGSAGSVTGGAAGSSGAGGSAGAGGATGTQCDPGLVQCDGPTPTCPEGQVPSVQGTCWGSCVPILDCAPVPSCAGCQGFCAAYAGLTTEYRCVMPSITCAALACSCMAKYFCVDPYNACDDQGGANDPPIICACPAC
jgi:hypothetical protein